MKKAGKRKAVEYLAESGDLPFGKWFFKLHAVAAAKVARAVVRMEEGNFSNTKSIGEGIFENKINYGPGYRIYFANDGDTIIILLAGGTKKSQSSDIRKARDYWMDYKRRR